jgi:hypothetical protein
MTLVFARYCVVTDTLWASGDRMGRWNPLFDLDEARARFRFFH